MNSVAFGNNGDFVADSENGTNGHVSAPAGGYQDKAAELSGITHNYMASMAKELGPVLTEQARSMPHGNLEEKRLVSKFVNNELRRFGLSIKCPQNGHPALLMAVPHDRNKSGRFTFQFIIPGGQARRGSMTEVPNLELIEAVQRDHGLINWPERVQASKNRDGASRA